MDTPAAPASGASASAASTQLSDYARESVIVYDLAGRLVYANPASARLYGWDAGSPQGQGFVALSRDAKASDAAWSQVLARGAWQGLLPRGGPAGETVFALVRLALRRDGAEQALDVVEYSELASRAVTEPSERMSSRAQRVQNACWQFSIAQARPLLEHAARDEGLDPIWQQDRLDRALEAVRTIDVNETAIGVFGLAGARERLMARPITSLWPEKGCAAIGAVLTRFALDELADTETVRLDTLGPLTDVVLTCWRGECRDMIFVCIGGTMNPHGKLLQLEASQDRYRNLISSLPLPVWEVDARGAGRILDRLRGHGVTDLDCYIKAHPELAEIAHGIIRVSDVNAHAIALFGAQDRSELIGPVTYLLGEAPGATKQIMMARFAGVRNYVQEIKIRTFDGRLRDVLLLITFPIPGERLDTTLVMMLDNTSRLVAEAKLQQLEADFQHAARLSTLGEMTASIAHEVRQPLSAIVTNIETALRWLGRPEPNLAKVTQLSDRIRASAHRATDIIERIQAMAGKRAPARKALDLNEVVRQALTFVRHDSDSKSTRVRLELQDDLPAVIGDCVQLQQVVVNLLINSIQAMRPLEAGKRDIVLTTEQATNGTVVLRVRDTGPGIPPGDLDRVFAGFFSTKEDGMGIGLAICQTIIMAHGGTIGVTNHPSGGAVFEVCVPAAQTLPAA